jgi:hypothetical protein
MLSGMNFTAAKFNSLANARSYSDRTVKASMVILGDDMKFWVVTMAVAAKLLAAGYEVAA